MIYLQIIVGVYWVLFLAWHLHRWMSKRRFARRPKRRTQSEEFAHQIFLARRRLVTALLGDEKAADRLINYEQVRAAPIGVGRLEAIERALLRLENDRSRS